jgi:hypothetical protein
MAKKKKAAKTKTKAKAKTKTKAKARKKISVKKRPVKNLDARKAKGPKGGLAVAATDQHIKLDPAAAAIKAGEVPTVATYPKLG